MKLNGIRVKRVGNSVFIPLPKEAQRPIDICRCDFCKAHPDRPPMWDTLAVEAKPTYATVPYRDTTWVVHYPELQEGN